MIKLFRNVFLSGLSALILCCLYQTATAADVPRRIIALHHPLGEKLRRHDLHSLAEMPLNWLGYVVDYHELEDGLPEDAIDDPNVVGVITWFKQGGMKNPLAYIDWANRMADAGKKFVIFGDFGFVAGPGGAPPVDPDKINRFLKRLGFKLGTDWTDITFDTEITHRDPEYYDFERQMGGRLPPYAVMEPVSAATDVMLKVRNRASGNESALLMVSPAGAFAATGWVYYKDPVYFRTQWYVNPFKLFTRVFGEAIRPVPDVTTLSGRRMYFSHIDGDGWRNVSLVRGYKKDQIYSARVVQERAIEPYPDLPITVGPIAADLDSRWSGDEQAQQIARELFLLPQVEMAHHTFSHPFEWAFFEDYSIEKEAAFVSFYDDPSEDAWGVDIARGRVKQEVKLKDAYDQPRGFGTYPFVLEREFGGASEVVNQFGPPGKKVEMVLWSGDTSPTERMLKASRDAGLLNLNGGDSRYDPEFPSMSYVPPVGFKAGSQQQIYAGNSNENTYTDLWSGRYFGFRDLVHTIRNTETPRRLKPFNVYYHMYSGERTNALNGLLANLDYARTQEIAPVKASHYAQIAEGFFTTRFERLSGQRWRVLDRGRLQTIRFDYAEKLSVNLAASSGVLGQTRFQGSLYVALDEAVDAPVIALQPARPQADQPYLVSARWHIHSLQRGDDTLQFRAHGFGDGDMHWIGLAPGQWVATAQNKAGKAVEVTTDVGSDGILRFTLPISAVDTVNVQLQRQGDG